MRRRTILLATAGAACLAVGLARQLCGTAVQVLDADGLPVVGASVQLLPAAGNVRVTDEQGRARLPDAWIQRPFAGRPAWVTVSKDGQHWWFAFPPGDILRLDRVPDGDSHRR